MSDENEKKKPDPKAAMAAASKLIMLDKLGLVVKWVLDIILWGFNVLINIIFTSLGHLSGILNKFIMVVSKAVKTVVPARHRQSVRQSLVYAGIDTPSEEVIAILTIHSFLFGLVGGIISSVVFKMSPRFTFFAGIFSAAGVWVAYIMIINMLIYRRTESVEESLPDMLDIIAQNMITGMTVYSSLWAAARPEFGPVADEIQAASKLTLTGVSLEEALFGVTERVKSDKLERAIKLITGGIRSGGELPAVLAGVSQDMRQERNLKKQMAAETSAYSIFILFTLFVGTPLLFSISHQFMVIFNTLFEETGLADMVAEGAGAGIGGGIMTMSAMAISPDFFLKYAVGTIISLAFFGAFLIGLIRTGKPIAGLAKVPQMVVVALGLFFLFKYALGLVFGNLIQF